MCCTGPQPPPRMGHTAVLISTSLIIFGGRDSPAHPLSDVWVLDTVKWQWLQASCKGDGPEARFRHTAVAAGSTVKVCTADSFFSIARMSVVWLKHV